MKSLHTLRCGSRHRHMAGVGMIEVLVAVLVLAAGMIGIAAMQMAALKSSQSALDRTQAVVQTYAILDAMRANRDEAIIGRYNIGMTCEAPEAGAGTLAGNDLDYWISSMQDRHVLGPSACGEIDCDDLECVIRVQWDDSRGQAGSDEHVVQTVTRL